MVTAISNNSLAKKSVCVVLSLMLVLTVPICGQQAFADDDVDSKAKTEAVAAAAEEEKAAPEADLDDAVVEPQAEAEVAEEKTVSPQAVAKNTLVINPGGGSFDTGVETFDPITVTEPAGTSYELLDKGAEIMAPGVEFIDKLAQSDDWSSSVEFSHWTFSGNHGVVSDLNYWNTMYTHGSANGTTDTLTANWKVTMPKRSAADMVYEQQYYNRSGYFMYNGFDGKTGYMGSVGINSAGGWVDSTPTTLGWSTGNKSYTFLGWNTKADGTGKMYAADTTITFRGTTTLYAQWKVTNGSANIDYGSITVPKSESTNLTVSYNTNGGSAVATSAANTKATVVIDKFTSNADGTGTSYACGTTLTADNCPALKKLGDVTIRAYAHQKKSAVTTPAAPTRNHYTFQGWNTKADGTGTTYAAGSSYTPSANTTLYAKWKKDANAPTVSYRTHVQRTGWQGWKEDGAVAGTTGQSLRLEGINLKLADVDGGIRYKTHVQSIGWQDWVTDGAMAGTTGRSLRLEAIQIELTGKAAEQYDIYYRVHAQNIGWMAWAKNGEQSGSAGYSYRLEGIQVMLVDKGTGDPGSFGGVTSGTDAKFVNYNATGSISYDATLHIQKYGDRSYKNTAGNTVMGTSGQALRLERFSISLNNTTGYAGNISYRTHVQSIGWQDWKKNGEAAGTAGRSLRLEALQIKLDGELAKHYDVYYQVHVQKEGWQGWKKNGEVSGTSGKSLRLEAMRIVLVKKGDVPPAA